MAFPFCTLHSQFCTEIGCQGWTRTNTVRFNKPSCYFDTTWQCFLKCRVQKCRMQNGVFRDSALCIRALCIQKLALPAGFPPASFRLEDGCLMCSATAA